MQLKNLIPLAVCFPLVAPASAQTPLTQQQDLFVDALGVFEPILNQLTDLAFVADAALQLLESTQDDPALLDFASANNRIWNAAYGSYFTVGANGHGTNIASLPVFFGVNSGTTVGSTPFHFTSIAQVNVSPEVPAGVPAAAITSYCASISDPVFGDQLMIAVGADATQLTAYAHLNPLDFTFVTLVPITEAPDGPLSVTQLAEAWALGMNGQFDARGSLQAWLLAQIPIPTAAGTFNPFQCIANYRTILQNSVATSVATHGPNVTLYTDLVAELTTTSTSSAIKEAGAAMADALPPLAVLQGIANAAAAAAAMLEGLANDPQHAAKVTEATINLENSKELLMLAVCGSVAEARANMLECLMNEWGSDLVDDFAEAFDSWALNTYGCQPSR